MLSPPFMGQHLTRQPASTDTRHRRRRPQSKRSHPNRDDDSEPSTGSCIAAGSPTRYRDHQTTRARSYDAETQDRGPRQRPIQKSKETTQKKSKKSKKHDEFVARKRPSRRKASDSVIAARHRNDQAEVSRSRTKLRNQPKSPHSLSSRQNPLKRSRPRETKDCVICADTLSLHRFPIRPPTVQCQHAVDVCRRCLRTWIQSEFATKIWDEMNCPVCSTRMQYEDMHEFAPNGVFRRLVLRSPPRYYN